MALRKLLDCKVVVCHIAHCENKLVDWLINVVQVLRVDWEPSKLSIRLGGDVPWPVV